MAKNWAIVVGINKYNPNNFARLKYAKRDAELMRDFFVQAKFDKVDYFADDPTDLVRPDDAEIPTYPSFGNLLSFLHDRFERPFLSAGDNLWFFFAGHGGRYGDRDYLMPIDANPRGSEPKAAILVSDVRDRLCRCGADNVILILDACRNEGSRSSPGIGTEAQQGVITISACSPTQKSWEIDEIQQGAFTKALLEALQIPGERNCATVERLDQYLCRRVPELCRQYGKFPEQNPCVSADPPRKYQFILLPQYAHPSDLSALREDAYKSAFIDGDLDLAEQLCIRAMAAASGQDQATWELNNRIQQLKAGNVQSTPQPRPANEESGRRLKPIEPSTDHPHPKIISDASQSGSRSMDANSATTLPVLNSAHSSRRLQDYRPNFAPRRSRLLTWWFPVILSILLNGLCGFALAWSSAPLWVWFVAVAVAGLPIMIFMPFMFAVFIVFKIIGDHENTRAANVIGFVGLIVGVSVSVAMGVALPWTVGGVVGWGTMAKFASIAWVAAVFITSYRRQVEGFKPYWIATAGLELGLGWLVHWVYTLYLA